MSGDVAAVIQARMGSSRLPGKTLMQAAGKPLLEHLVERLRRATTLDRIIVATTTNAEDDQIDTLCARLGADCFRGSVDDVLGRVAAALQHFGVDLHVEIHGDGPLADWRLIDEAVQVYRRGSFDLVTNALRITYPPGLELWVYSAELAARLARECTAQKHREGPILYVMEHVREFAVHNIDAPPALHAPDTYIEVDEAADFDVMKSIIEALYPQNRAFLPEDVLAWLSHRPEIRNRNRHVVRRWREATP